MSAIEPQVNLGWTGVRILEDGWTAVTLDGSWSAHFEHTVAITPNGPVILTPYRSLDGAGLCRSSRPRARWLESRDQRRPEETMAVASKRSTIDEEYWKRFPASAELFARARSVDSQWRDPRRPQLCAVSSLHVAGRGRLQMGCRWKRLLDHWMGHGSLILGHNHPIVTEAVQEALARGTHLGACHEDELEWAELVTQLIPSAEEVRFTMSGTESTMLALRDARAFTGKPKSCALPWATSTAGMTTRWSATSHRSIARPGRYPGRGARHDGNVAPRRSLRGAAGARPRRPDRHRHHRAAGARTEFSRPTLSSCRRCGS